jgi:GMP reductase
MRIENDIKLDFKDVLIRPKRSTLASRKDVNISRTYAFKWSGQTYSGLPIIAANMDGVGTFAMARAFRENGNGMTVALHKHYVFEALSAYFSEYGGADVWYSIGITDDDLAKLKKFLESPVQKEGRGIQKLCIDVANGYSQQFIDFIQRIREIVPQDITLMAGNVVTGEMVEELILCDGEDSCIKLIRKRKISLLIIK